MTGQFASKVEYKTNHYHVVKSTIFTGTHNLFYTSANRFVCSYNSLPEAIAQADQFENDLPENQLPFGKEI